MTSKVYHRFVSAVADGGDATVVRPQANWNDTHDLYLDAVTRTAATDTIAAADLGLHVTYNRAAGVAVSLPQANSGAITPGTLGFFKGWFCFIYNGGLGAVTITPTTSTILGATSLTLNTNQGVLIVSDGTNYIGSFKNTTVSVFGRANNVVAAAGDYSADQIANNVFGFRNRIINPSGQVQQTATGAKGNATYSAWDQWYILTQSGNVTEIVTANAENGTPFLMRFQNTSGSSQRWGAIQWLESANCIDLRGKTVTFSVRGTVSSTDNIRMAILEWTGTADGMGTSLNPVNDWTSSTYTTGNFFKSTNMAVTVVSPSLTAGNSGVLANLSATGTIGSSANNIAVFIWVEGAAANTQSLYFGKAQLEIGPAPTPLAFRDYGTELALCQRYFWRLPNPNSVANIVIGFGQAYSTTNWYAAINFPTMRAPPSLTYSNISHFIVNDAGGGTANCTGSLGIQFQSLDRARVFGAVTAGLVAGNATSLVTNNTSATFDLNARL